MNYSTLSGLLISSLLLVPVAYAGEKYSGKWDGKTPTSIDIRSKNPLIVRYCYERDCNLMEPSGTLNKMTFKFLRRGKFPGAVMTMRKSGSKYLGVWKRNGTKKKFTATLIK